VYRFRARQDVAKIFFTPAEFIERFIIIIVTTTTATAAASSLSYKVYWQGNAQSAGSGLLCHGCCFINAIMIIVQPPNRY
jgi:hypothetical protein